MRARAFPLALFTLALAAQAAAAQYSDDPGQRQYGGHGGRMHGMGMGRGTPPDPVVLQGPPAPADFQKLVQLPDAKLPGYRNLFDHLMEQTKPQRDSLAALRNGMGDSGDRASFQERREIFQPLSQELTRRQAAFDDALKDMLDKDQWKRYQKWRDDQRKAAAKERQERWKHRENGDATGAGQPPA
jgi:hypothetical protein